MAEDQLIFAQLIRVSTEAQALRGESLRTQRKQLDEAVATLRGTTYGYYAGQEHATPDHERKILESLIKDAVEKKFNAVIVADVSRWSRHNEKSAEYLKILRDNRIKFFVRTTEYDLFDNFHELILIMGVAINQFHAKEQTSKSLKNRIERAKGGNPTCGKKPYGRDFREGKWILLLEAKEKIAEIARLYLDDDISFEVLGEKYGMNPSNLHKILTKRSGDTWVQRFRKKNQNIDETVVTKIPRLLPDEIIDRIKKKCEARRTWQRGAQKYEYLFSGIIFDSNTGYTLTGTPSPRGKRYYKTYKGNSKIYMVNAESLEQSVLETFFSALGNNHSIMKAVFDGNPFGKASIALKKEKAILERELLSHRKKQKNLVNALEKYEVDDQGQSMNILIDRLKSLDEITSKMAYKIATIENQLNTLPTKKEIEDNRALMRSQIFKRTQESIFMSGLVFSDLPFEDKQRLIRLIFGGTDEMGRRYGIYIKPIESRPRKYAFEAYGKLGNVKGWLVRRGHSSFSDSDMRIRTHEDQYMADNIAKIVKDGDPDFFSEKNKEDLPSKCHAHYGFGFHKRR